MIIFTSPPFSTWNIKIILKHLFITYYLIFYNNHKVSIWLLQILIISKTKTLKCSSSLIILPLQFLHPFFSPFKCKMLHIFSRSPTNFKRFIFDTNYIIDTRSGIFVLPAKDVSLTKCCQLPRTLQIYTEARLAPGCNCTVQLYRDWTTPTVQLYSSRTGTGKVCAPHFSMETL